MHLFSIRIKFSLLSLVFTFSFPCLQDHRSPSEIFSEGRFSLRFEQRLCFTRKISEEDSQDLWNFRSTLKFL